MKALISKVVLLTLLCASFAGSAVAQLGSIRGTCKDAQGAPIVGAEIVWKNQNNGRTYKLKTDKKGGFFSLGIEPGDYEVTLSRDGQVLNQDKRVHVGLDELTHDIDLKQAQEQGAVETAKKEGKTTEQVKLELEQKQAEAAKTQQFNANVKVVNDKLTAGKQLLDEKNYPQAIATFQEATTILPDNDIVWYRLGNAYVISAAAQTDSAERKKQNLEAFNDLQKAVDLKKAAPQQSDPGKEEANKHDLAVYYDNLGASAGRLGKLDDTAAAYEQAVKLDPSNAGRYYFNLGIALHNNAMDTDTKKKAAEAFDKAITADPNKVDAYFFKGTDLFAMLTMKEDGTPVPVPGTVEALQKYLELQPSGGYAEQAKGMLQVLNQKVETGFGTPKKKK